MPAFRPHLHFAPPFGWMNDPNGLVFHDGLWHLFYQYFPDGLQHGPMHWGHAASPDLLSWRHYPIALAPDELGNNWSGSAVSLPSEMLLCFTHQNDESQSQSLARSFDGGQTFVKDANNPILRSERRDFRDPKLFRWQNEWRMIVAAGMDAQIFASTDLHNWKIVGEFPAPHPDWIWECPDLLEVDGRWILIGSFVIPGRPHESYFWMGDFDGARFSPCAESSTRLQRLSFGPDDYAAVGWNDAPDARRVIIGWMSRWDYAANTPTEDEGFRGAMTLPRELSLRGDTLLQNPPRELTDKRRESASLGGLDAGKSLAIDAMAFEIEAEIAPNTAAECGLVLHFGEAERVVVGFDAARNELFIDRTQSGATDFHPDFGGRFNAPLQFQNALQLRIVVDACSVEVFADSGAVYGAALVFPSSPATSITFYGEGAQITKGAISTYIV